ncbi:hypothetical protein EU520_00765 [Candidatus Thorarchaeota archaeon]|nr:MAG: hypothetical protein EU520_00765 [Candidatus Thorarchaeota archaeon]
MDALTEMDDDFLSAILDAFPMEFSVIDAEDKVRFWNQHETRIFRRGHGVLGRDVRNCHPKKSVDKVLDVIASLRSGERDHVDFWIDLPEDDRPRKLLIRYFAIRDENGEYLGTLETTLNLTPLQEIRGENRLGDFKKD